LIHCSPQPPINFSRNTRLTPIAQTCQFLLPVEIRTLQIDPLLPAASNQFQQKPQANTYSPNQSISTPRRNQYPAKLIHCSPQPPINFSRNTRLTPIAQTCQFLLPVEIRTLQIDPLLPAASNQLQQKPQANTYSPNQSISTPRRNQTLQIDLLLPVDSNQFQQKTQAYF